MVTIALSQGISWATYASDYSRYLKASILAGGNLLADPGRPDRLVRLGGDDRAGRSQRAREPDSAGVRTLMGGGTLGVLALIAIVFGAITSNSMNDYTGSLAFQALGVRLRRPVTAALVAVVAFAAILWMQAGDTCVQVPEHTAVHRLLDRAVLRDRDDRLARPPGQRTTRRSCGAR